MSHYKQEIWNSFCKRYQVKDTGVPMFSINDGAVSIIKIGKNDRMVLKRSQDMETLIITEVSKVLEDYSSGKDLFEGLIYMMYYLANDSVIPLYIGKSEKYGKFSGNLSENIKNIEKNKYKFCRWGYGYDYHIGDLSAVVCEGHPNQKIRPKYKKWAKALFANYPSSTLRLRFPVYYWIMAWEKGQIGIWEDFGATSLTFLEYLLIGVASDLFPEHILNEEGVNR